MRADVDETRASFTSSLYRVTLFEDPAYHSLIEKIITNKSLLLKDFERADTKKSGTELASGSSTTPSLSRTDHLPLTIWAEIMSSVLQVDLPWLLLRTKLVQEDDKGILYRTMFDNYILDNSKFQMVGID